MRALAKSDPVWRLAGASKSKPNHSGTFSPHSITSHHTFGWDRSRPALVLQSDFGMGVAGTEKLPLPLGLAELFLRRCQDRMFAEPFLESYCPKEEVKETLEFEGHALNISCSAYKSGRAGHNATLPSLSLSSGSARLWLFYELRDSFAKRIKILAPEDIQTNLRPL